MGGNSSGGTGGGGGYCGGGGGGGEFGGSAGAGGGNGGGTGSSNGGGYGSGGAGTGAGGGGGGFGGGGGAGEIEYGGGGGGFGGGAGYGGTPGSYGGTSPGFYGGGGGGAGIGGGIFVGDHAHLVISDASGTASNLSGNLASPGIGGASGGSSGGPGGNGVGLANDLFLFQKATVTFSAAVNLPLGFSIQGDPASSVGSGTADGGVTINMNTNALAVTYTGTNNYQGGTTITQGILNSVGASLPTIGTIAVGTTNGTFNLTSGTFPSVISTNAGTINIAGTFSPATTSTNSNLINVSTGGAFTIPTTYTNSGTIAVASGGILNVAAALSGIVTNAGTTNVTAAFTPANSSTNTSIMKISGGGTFTEPTTYTYSGTINVDNNAPFIGTITGDNNVAILNFGEDNSITGTISNAFTNVPFINLVTANTSITFSGAFTGVNTLSLAASTAAIFSNTYSGSGPVNNSGTLTIQNTFTSGTITNSSTGTLALASGTHVISSNIVNQASGIVSVNSQATVNAANTISNSGTMTISNTFSSGTITNTNTGSLFLASGTNVISSNIVNQASGIVSVNSQATVNAANTISNSGTMTISNTFSSGTITNTSTGSLYLASGTNVISSNITNQATGNVYVNSQATLNAANTITNQGTMTISAQLAGSGTINNSNVLTLQNGANVANAITNSGIMTSTGTVNISNTVTNSNLMTISNTLTMPGNAHITGNGTVTMVGDSAVTAASYTNTGTHTTNISGSGASNVGKVTTTGAIDVAAIVVTSSVTTGGPWTILTAGAGELTYGSYTLPTASSGPFVQWSVDTSDNTNFIVELTGAAFSQVAIGPINKAIAAVLDVMNSYSNKNAGQQALLNALSAAANAAEFNAWVQELMPNNNATTPSIFLQDKVFRRVEKRIASLDQNMLGADYGIAAGDISPNVAMWIGGFGSFARLAPNYWGENLGYRSKSFGTIIGIDKRSRCDNIFGFGFGLSKSIIYEYSNSGNTTNIIGYHGVAYGTNYLSRTRFFEWLFTGAFTMNTPSRQINIDDIVMSTFAKYHAGQGGLRINYGFDLACADYFSLVPVGSVQYIAAYEPNYTENYSPAALIVEPRHFQNVLTFGAGARLDFPCDDWWLIGTRELRLMVTYDAVTTNNNVAASFLVGSPDFYLTNSPPERLALKAGIDFGFSIFDCLHVVFSYDYELRHQYYDHSGTAKIKFLF